MQQTPSVYVGVAGWSYPDWRDTVYRLSVGPAQLSLFGASESGAATYADDELAFLASYVDMIEVNSSFYRIPAVRTTGAWARRVAAQREFFFTAKLHQAFTHDLRTDPAQAAQFRDAFAPLRDAGRLRALLAQFRYDTCDSAATRRLLQWLVREFARFAPLVVEVRHRSWQEPEALAFLRGLGVTVANLDYPTARDSFDLRVAGVGASAYLRLHGRNRRAWFARDADVAETYNYDYSEAEITELATRAREILGNAASLTIVANNHYRGKAVSAALRLKSRLTGKSLRVPPALLESYPALQRLSAPHAE